MKFADLKFKRHPNSPDATQARVNFPNGYGASIITGSMFYTDPKHPYELAVLKNDRLCYDTCITDDVLGHLTKQDVQDNLDLIEALEAPK